MKKFDPQTMTRATHADIVRMWRKLYGDKPMPKTMTQLEYVKSLNPNAPIPHSVMTCGELAEVLQSRADLQEGMRLMIVMSGEVGHPVTDMQETEQAIDAQIAMQKPTSGIDWDSPEHREAAKAGEDFDMSKIEEIKF